MDERVYSFFWFSAFVVSGRVLWLPKNSVLHQAQDKPYTIWQQLLYYICLVCVRRWGIYMYLYTKLGLYALYSGLSCARSKRAGQSAKNTLGLICMQIEFTISLLSKEKLEKQVQHRRKRWNTKLGGSWPKISTIVEPQNPGINIFYEAQKCGLADFEARKLRIFGLGGDAQTVSKLKNLEGIQSKERQLLRLRLLAGPRMQLLDLKLVLNPQGIRAGFFF